MKVLIAGTPLESMVWRRVPRNVRFRWRDMPAETLVEFLNDLIRSAEVERDRIVASTYHPNPAE